MYHRKHCKVYASDLAKTAVKLIFVFFLIRNCLFYEPFLFFAVQVEYRFNYMVYDKTLIDKLSICVV